MSHPNNKGAWLEWERDPTGATPILVIETDLQLRPGVNGMPSADLDDMIDQTIAEFEKPNFKISRTRIVPTTAYRA